MSELQNGENRNEHNEKSYVEDGKNKFSICCKYCGSKILDEKSGVYVTEEKELPLIQQANNRKEGEIENELITEFFQVENMFVFENIGFTHTVANTKYLSCADCELGPVGYYDINNRHCFVAVSRVQLG